MLLFFVSYNDCCDDFLDLCHLESITNAEECVVVPEVPEDRRENKNILKIMGYNTRWLFTNVTMQYIFLARLVLEERRSKLQARNKVQ